MPKRIVVGTVRVLREGKVITAPIGDPNGFEFSAEELEQINRANPKALKKITRTVEDADESGDLPPDLSTLTVDQLKALAAERKVDLGTATKKADILALLEGTGKSGEEEL